MAIHVLPVIQEWPYEGITEALAQFRETQSKNPSILWVGRALWIFLRKACDAEEFYAIGKFPIRLDRTSILEPHEFMFTCE
jgi:hypothetical protein